MMDVGTAATTNTTTTPSTSSTDTTNNDTADENNNTNNNCQSDTQPSFASASSDTPTTQSSSQSQPQSSQQPSSPSSSSITPTTPPPITRTSRPGKDDITATVATATTSVATDSSASTSTSPAVAAPAAAAIQNNSSSVSSFPAATSSVPPNTGAHNHTNNMVLLETNLSLPESPTHPTSSLSTPTSSYTTYIRTGEGVKQQVTPTRVRLGRILRDDENTTEEDAARSYKENNGQSDINSRGNDNQNKSHSPMKISNFGNSNESDGPTEQVSSTREQELLKAIEVVQRLAAMDSAEYQARLIDNTLPYHETNTLPLSPHLSQLTQSIHRFHSVISNLTKDYDEQTTEIVELRTKYHAAQKRNEKLEKAVSKLHTRNLKLKKQSHSDKSVARKLMDQMKTLTNNAARRKEEEEFLRLANKVQQHEQVMRERADSNFSSVSDMVDVAGSGDVSGMDGLDGYQEYDTRSVASVVSNQSLVTDDGVATVRIHRERTLTWPSVHVDPEEEVNNDDSNPRNSSTGTLDSFQDVDDTMLKLGGTSTMASPKRKESSSGTGNKSNNPFAMFLGPKTAPPYRLLFKAPYDIQFVAIPQVLPDPSKDEALGIEPPSATETAYVVCGYHGFDSNVNVKPTLGARLIAINRVPIGEIMAADASAKDVEAKILAQGKTTNLTFRNDHWDKSQKAILNRAVREQEKRIHQQQQQQKKQKQQQQQQQKSSSSSSTTRQEGGGDGGSGHFEVPFLRRRAQSSDSVGNNFMNGFWNNFNNNNNDNNNSKTNDNDNTMNDTENREDQKDEKDNNDDDDDNKNVIQAVTTPETVPKDELTIDNKTNNNNDDGDNKNVSPLNNVMSSLWKNASMQNDNVGTVTEKGKEGEDSNNDKNVNKQNDDADDDNNKISSEEFDKLSFPVPDKKDREQQENNDDDHADDDKPLLSFKVQERANDNNDNNIDKTINGSDSSKRIKEKNDDEKNYNIPADKKDDDETIDKKDSTNNTNIDINNSNTNNTILAIGTNNPTADAFASSMKNVENGMKSMGKLFTTLSGNR